MVTFMNDYVVLKNVEDILIMCKVDRQDHLGSGNYITVYCLKILYKGEEAEAVNFGEDVKLRDQTFRDLREVMLRGSETN